ncbi:hypothetical protein RHGRI_016549 [Rhododendron griersonianum]|uniref:Uncharacterized protein n=1 Tax=Rhododendron griersonianum TaxID=479676 RepID=A0AAV6JUK8_9ERIC|nr:hypothetical protein RHGRI_016549 [Rhododendron griersonianum]
MDKRLRALFNESRTWVVSAAGDGVYEVHSFPDITVEIIRRIAHARNGNLLDFHVPTLSSSFLHVGRI